MHRTMQRVSGERFDEVKFRHAFARMFGSEPFQFFRVTQIVAFADREHQDDVFESLPYRLIS